MGNDAIRQNGNTINSNILMKLYSPSHRRAHLPPVVEAIRKGALAGASGVAASTDPPRHSHFGPSGRASGPTHLQPQDRACPAGASKVSVLETNLNSCPYTLVVKSK